METKDAPHAVKVLYAAFCALRDFGFPAEDIFVSFHEKQNVYGISLTKEGQETFSVGLGKFEGMTPEELLRSWQWWATSIVEKKLSDEQLHQMLDEANGKVLRVALLKALMTEKIQIPFLLEHSETGEQK